MRKKSEKHEKLDKRILELAFERLGMKNPIRSIATKSEQVPKLVVVK